LSSNALANMGWGTFVSVGVSQRGVLLMTGGISVCGAGEAIGSEATTCSVSDDIFGCSRLFSDSSEGVWSREISGSVSSGVLVVIETGVSISVSNGTDESYVADFSGDGGGVVILGGGDTVSIAETVTLETGAAETGGMGGIVVVSRGVMRLAVATGVSTGSIFLALFLIIKNNIIPNNIIPKILPPTISHIREVIPVVDTGRVGVFDVTGF